MYGTSEGATAIYGYSTSQVGVNGVSGNNYGVSGNSANSHGVYGSTNSESHFDFYAASTDGNNYGSPLSRRWKKNIYNIPNPLEMISKLRGVYYDWDEEHGGHHAIGFIAEEVGEVIPEIVVYEENGTDAVGMDYSKMTPLLLESINALEAKFEKKFIRQEEHIKELESEIEKMTGRSAHLNNWPSGEYQVS